MSDEPRETQEVTSPEHSAILEKLNKLEEALEANNPGMKFWLEQIHKGLKDQPGIVQLLKPTEIASVVKGYEVVSKHTLAEVITKSKGGSTQKLKKLTVDDL